MKFKVLFCLLLLAIHPAIGKELSGPKDGVILIIRHAEKPVQGYTLTPAGVERAKAYVNYFKNYTLDSKPFTLDYLFAAADSPSSHRSRLTIEPLSRAIGLPIDSHFKHNEYQELADKIGGEPPGKHILICWRHEDIPGLVHALGGNPDQLIPGGKWPEQVFGWVIQLRYNGDGKLIKAERIEENLMPDDSDAIKAKDKN
jgi:hypothetical protein